MTYTANHYYRLDAGRFLAAVVQVPVVDRGEWVLKLALDLVASDADAASSEFAKTLIEEANEFRGRKANAGRLGGLAKASSARQCSSSALAKASTPLANTVQNKNLKTSSSSADDGYPVDFLNFWQAYPRKVGKGAAFKTWQRQRVGNGKVSLILAAVERQKSSEQWQKDGGQFIPHPATWLGQRRWEDEAEETHPETSTEDIPAWLSN